MTSQRLVSPSCEMRAVSAGVYGCPTLAIGGLVRILQMSATIFLISCINIPILGWEHLKMNSQFSHSSNKTALNKTKLKKKNPDSEFCLHFE